MPAPDEYAGQSVNLNSRLDPCLEGLGQAHFDPVQYLNDNLPSLTLSSQPSSSQQSRIGQLHSASTEGQTFLTKLNAHNIRTSTDLTRLTDGILRNANRLAYEVEVLRGDTNNLYDLLTGTLQADIENFVQANNTTETFDDRPADGRGLNEQGYEMQHQDSPEFIRQLRTLAQVKSRLESVVNVFGEALKWPIPPSEVSVSASLISVSSPELGVANSAEDDQAREITRQLRNEISDLLAREGGGQAGIELATKKLNEFRDLNTVWRGTAEEKARTRVVEGFAKMIEDRRKSMALKAAAPAKPSPESSRANVSQGRTTTPGTAAAGLFRNLQKLRDEIYLE